MRPLKARRSRILAAAAAAAPSQNEHTLVRRNYNTLSVRVHYVRGCIGQKRHETLPLNS